LPAASCPRVGIVWAGSPDNRTDSQRSCALAEFLPLLRIPTLAFYSLQKGERAKDLADVPAAVTDLQPLLGDFGDTAVIVDQLDLLITVDTAAAHLAGALGKPVWNLLTDVADWRWGLQGETTPWYPTMRLFRQTEPGDWKGMMERVAEALKNTFG
jgi:ADP-heptose:LPS heptosyltransferase